MIVSLLWNNVAFIQFEICVLKKISKLLVIHLTATAFLSDALERVEVYVYFCWVSRDVGNFIWDNLLNETELLVIFFRCAVFLFRHDNLLFSQLLWFTESIKIIIITVLHTLLCLSLIGCQSFFMYDRYLWCRLLTVKIQFFFYNDVVKCQHVLIITIVTFIFFFLQILRQLKITIIVCVSLLRRRKPRLLKPDEHLGLVIRLYVGQWHTKIIVCASWTIVGTFAYLPNSVWIFRWARNSKRWSLLTWARNIDGGLMWVFQEIINSNSL